MELGIDAGAGNIRAVLLDDLSIKKRIFREAEGQPIKKTIEILEEIPYEEFSVGITGSNRKIISELIKVGDIIDPVAILKYLEIFYSDARTVFDIGKENSRLYIFKKDNGNLVLEDFSVNLSCGAGGGTLIEKMSKRLKFKNLEEFVNEAYNAESVANISARCSVFAESDVVHHYQRGSDVESIAAGLCQVVSRNFVNNICRDKETIEPVYIIGGVSKNKSVVRFLEDELKCNLIVPENSLEVKAIGAALSSSCRISKKEMIERLFLYKPERGCSMKPLFLEKSKICFLPYEVISKENGNEITLSLNKNYDFYKDSIDVFLGLDVGSVSTKVALIDKDGEFILGVYGRTSGEPIEAVREVIRELGEVEVNSKGSKKKIKELVEVIGASTTGSGRDVAGKIVGADVVKNEITAQAKGAVYFFPDADTVFEIGGQDSKYIFMDRGIVIENEMNKACAASTGSFLEEQANSLGLKIEEEFANCALASSNPLDLGDRCTVFITNSLLTFQDASLEDKCAGLAYSICKNYLNRVVRGKKIGDNIIFQGAVAFNKAVVAGFGTELRKKIHVPEYPHLSGAIGAAKISKENLKDKSKFKGFGKISDLEYEQRIFQCDKCENRCDVSEIKTEDSVLYYGDRCERYSGSGTDRKIRLPNLFEERAEILMSYKPAHKKGRKIIGIPRTGLFNDLFPFWTTFFNELEFNVKVSEKTNKKIIKRGLEETTADFCLPFKVAFGHYAELDERDVDFIFAPDIIESFIRQFEDETIKDTEWDKSYTCPYLQNIGCVVAKNAVKNKRVINPHMSLRENRKALVKNFYDAINYNGLNVKKENIGRAIDLAEKEYYGFKRKLRERGREVLGELKDKREGIVIVGRTYSAYDSAINLNLAKKILTQGFLAIPMDYLSLPCEDLSLKWKNEFGIAGQYLLGIANVIKRQGLNAVFLDYFACGPNSFFKSFFAEEIGKPYLTLQIDEHTADAGIVTRLEAFLDGIK